jgi:hypothetical protein
MVMTIVGLKPMISGLIGRHLNHKAAAPLDIMLKLGIILTKQSQLI